MSEILIKYSNLNDAINASVKVRGYIDDYSDKISSVIKKSCGSLPGNDADGYAGTATRKASEKMDQLLNTKKQYFSNFEKTAQDVIDAAKSADTKVSQRISSVAEGYIEERKWYEKAGDWIYNTFCVDLVNMADDLFPGLRTVVDGIKWIGDKVGNVVEKVHNWFKYGDGKYIWKIGVAIVGAVVAVGSVFAAICALPAAGTFLFVMGVIGVIAGAVSAVITVGNAITTVSTNAKALSLSGDILDDDDGDPGAARYYGKATKMSDAIEKFDFGDKGTNDFLEKTGEVADALKVVADTTSFVCSIASLGAVKDYRITDPSKSNVTGYSFSYDNIKKNILHSMGYKTSAGGFKDGSFAINLISSDTVEKTYTFYNYRTGEKIFALPETLVKVFNGAKTTKNVMSFTENVDGIYDFVTDSDKTGSDAVNVMQKITGIMGTTKAGKPIDTYITGTYKTLDTIVSAVTEQPLINDAVKLIPKPVLSFAGSW